jgi:hypothetical protein
MISLGKDDTPIGWGTGILAKSVRLSWYSRAALAPLLLSQ